MMLFSFHIKSDINENEARKSNFVHLIKQKECLQLGLA